MKCKKMSGKTPLFALYKKRPPLFYKSAVAVTLIAQLFVMYIIQNNFQSARFQALGVILLLISLLASSLLLSLFLKRMRNKSE